MKRQLFRARKSKSAPASELFHIYDHAALTKISLLAQKVLFVRGLKQQLSQYQLL